MSYEATQDVSDQSEHKEASEITLDNTAGDRLPEEAVCTDDELLNVAKQSIANNIVKNHVIASITVGLVPVPLFDLSALMATQMNMLSSLSDHYEVPFNDMDSKSLITSLVSGSVPVLSVLGLSSFTKIIPGVGSLAGSASMGVIGGAVTYAVGQVFIMHYEEGGTLEDFNPSKAQAYFKREIKAGKSFVVALRDEIKEARAENSKKAEQE